MSDISFWGIAAFMVVSGLLVVFSQSLFRSAFFLALAFSGFGMLYFMLDAPLVGAIQILIYAGAVTMLLMFVIMLTRQEGRAPRRLGELLRSITAFQLFSGALCAALLFSLVSQLGAVRWRTADAVPGFEGTAQQAGISALLFGQFAFAFEVVGMLLLAALIGAVVLARTDDAADGDTGGEAR